MGKYQGSRRTSGWRNFAYMGVITILLLGTVAQGAEALLSEKLLPPDPVLAIVLKDCSATKTRWQSTALYEVLQDPEMKAMFQPLRATLTNLYTKAQAVAPAPFQSLKELTTGEAGMSVSVVMGVEGPEPVFQFVMTPKDLPKAREELNKFLDALVVANMLNQQNDDGQTRTFSVADEGLLRVTYDENIVAITLSSEAGESLHTQLLERNVANQTGLFADPEYAAVRAKIDDDFEGWVYIGALPWLEKNMGNMNQAVPMLGISGLADYQGIIVGVRIEDRGFRTRAFARKKADVQVAMPDIPMVTSPDLMKVPSDVESFTIGSLDFVAIYDKFMPLLGIVPAGGEVMGMANRFEAITGLNLRDDVLGMFGKRFMVFIPEVDSPAGEGVAAFVRINDREVAAERLKKSLEGIVALIREKAGPKTDPMVRIQSQDREAFTQVYPQSILPGMFTPNLTVTDEWVGLSFSARAGLARTRYLLDDQKKNILSRKNFTDIYTKVPTRCHFMHYEDVGSNFGNLLAGTQLLSDIGIGVAKIAAMEGELPLPITANELWGMDPGRFPDDALFRDKLFGSIAVIAYQNDGTLFESFSPIGPIPVITRRWRNGGPQTKIATTSILAGLLLPALARARGQARRTACMSNLHQISIAIMMYNEDNEGAYPDKLQSLIPKYLGTDRVFQCPSAEGPGPHYAYIGGIPGDLARNLGPNAIIAYDLPNNHDNGRNVLFHDGHARWMPEFMFQEELANALEQAEAAFNAAGIAMPETMRDFLNDEVDM